MHAYLPLFFILPCHAHPGLILVNRVCRGVTTTGAPGAGAPPAILLKIFFKEVRSRDCSFIYLFLFFTENTPTFETRLFLNTKP